MTLSLKRPFSKGQKYSTLFQKAGIILVLCYNPDNMEIKSKILSYQTEEELQFIDITEEVEKFVLESGIAEGFINIQTMHTTGAVLLNENEPLLIEDIKKNLKRVASKEVGYKHDDFKVRTVNMCDDECANGHAHCKAVYLPSNIVLNVSSKKIQLGQWQRIFFIELDRPRPRKVHIQIMGKASA